MVGNLAAFTRQTQTAISPRSGFVQPRLCEAAHKRGKIERVFKTIRSQLLSVVDEGVSLKELNQALWDWIDNDYHQRIHSSTKETPLARYLKHIHLIREAPKDMEDYFRKRITRRVHKDRTVSLNTRLFEAPTGLIGKIVTLLFHEHDPLRVEVLLGGTSHGYLVPLDLNINYRVRRDHHTTEIVPIDKTSQPCETPDFYKNGQLFGQGDSDDEL